MAFSIVFSDGFCWFLTVYRDKFSSIWQHSGMLHSFHRFILLNSPNLSSKTTVLRFLSEKKKTPRNGVSLGRMFT